MGAAQFLLLLAQVAGAPPAAPEPIIAPAPAPEPEAEQASPPEVDPEIIAGRRRPGYQTGLPDREAQDNPGAVREIGRASCRERV